MSGNAWPGDRTNRDGGPQGPAQEQHIPVRSFNAKEAREELFRGRLPQVQYPPPCRGSSQTTPVFSVCATMLRLLA